MVIENLVVFLVGVAVGAIVTHAMSTADHPAPKVDHRAVERLAARARRGRTVGDIVASRRGNGA